MEDSSQKLRGAGKPHFTVRSLRLPRRAPRKAPAAARAIAQRHRPAAADTPPPSRRRLPPDGGGRAPPKAQQRDRAKPKASRPTAALLPREGTANAAGVRSGRPLPPGLSRRPPRRPPARPGGGAGPPGALRRGSPHAARCRAVPPPRHARWLNVKPASRMSDLRLHVYSRRPPREPPDCRPTPPRPRLPPATR